MQGREAVLGLLHVACCAKGLACREGVHTYALAQRYILLLHVYISSVEGAKCGLFYQRSLESWRLLEQSEEESWKFQILRKGRNRRTWHTCARVSCQGEQQTHKVDIISRQG